MMISTQRNSPENPLRSMLNMIQPRIRFLPEHKFTKPSAIKHWESVYPRSNFKISSEMHIRMMGRDRLYLDVTRIVIVTGVVAMYLFHIFFLFIKFTAHYLLSFIGTLYSYHRIYSPSFSLSRIMSHNFPFLPFLPPPPY